MNKARILQAIDEALNESEDDNDHHEKEIALDSRDECHNHTRIGVTRVNLNQLPNQIKRVQVGISPWFNVFHDHQSFKMTVDSGVQINMIREDVAALFKPELGNPSNRHFWQMAAPP